MRCLMNIACDKHREQRDYYLPSESNTKKQHPQPITHTNNCHNWSFWVYFTILRRLHAIHKVMIVWDMYKVLESQQKKIYLFFQLCLTRSIHETINCLRVPHHLMSAEKQVLLAGIKAEIQLTGLWILNGRQISGSWADPAGFRLCHW